ncbi:MAG: hypothetical protein ACKVU4_08755 [Phycisphaerales bacterium]
MNSKTRAAVACGMLIGTFAHAQKTITFDIRYSDPVLTPGEVQHIEVWAILSPGPGATVIWAPPGANPLPAIVRQFGYAALDVTNVLNGETGSFSNLLLPSPFSLYTGQSVGAPGGGGGVAGIGVGQPPAPPWNPTNPIHLWSAIWTPLDYTPRIVEFTTFATADPAVHVEFGFSPPWGFDYWKAVSVSTPFQVIPAPATLIPSAGFGLLGFALRRRREC